MANLKRQVQSNVCEIFPVDLIQTLAVLKNHVKLRFSNLVQSQRVSYPALGFGMVREGT